MTKPEYFRTANALLVELGIWSPADIDIEAIAYYCGAIVRYRRLTGCAARVVGNNDTALITVDSNSNRGRQRFSAAHELGHWMHDRGKGCFSCEEAQFIKEWSHNNPETRANRYASDLLLPKVLFRPEATAYRSMDFDTVKELAKTFETSLTATAIRLAEYGPCPTMLICYNAAGREWFVRGSVSKVLWPPDAAQENTYAFDLLNKEGAHEARGAVDASVWFDHPVAAGFGVEEHSIRIRQGNVLSLLWWKDEDMLIKIEELEDERAARRSDGRLEE